MSTDVTKIDWDNLIREEVSAEELRSALVTFCANKIDAHFSNNPKMRYLFEMYRTVAEIDEVDLGNCADLLTACYYIEQ